MEDIHENCGIAAVHIKDKKQSVTPILYKLLLNLQNRGQLSAGISTYNDRRPNLLDTYKQIGPVNEVFRTSNPLKTEIIFRKYAGSMGIGHVRYATCGANDKNYAQPYERKHGRKWKWFSFAFNGTISNYSELKKPLLEKSGYHFTLDCDTEIVMHYLARAFIGNVKPPFTSSFLDMVRKFDGAYTIAFLNADGDLILIRDPWGFRPMAYGYLDDNTFVAASETNALSNVGVRSFKYLNPGELLHMNKEGKFRVVQYTKPRKKSFCMFEWVYFANVSSILEKKSVYVARTNLGKELARLEPLKVNKKDYIVIPVPDSAKAAGDSYAYELGLPAREGLVRNRYVGRTFIEGRKSRRLKVKTKYSIVREIIRGKKVILVDDSIVRGTTLKELISYIRDEGGAKEVHIRVSCPPIMGPCFYGIDMSTVSELWAPKFIKRLDEHGNFDKKILKKMADDVGADSLIYNNVDGTVKSIGLKRLDLCLACLTTKYPTKIGKVLYEKACGQASNGTCVNRNFR